MYSWFKDYFLCLDLFEIIKVVQETASIAKEARQMLQLLGTKSPDPRGDLPLNPTDAHPHLT